MTFQQYAEGCGKRFAKKATEVELLALKNYERTHPPGRCPHCKKSIRSQFLPETVAHAPEECDTLTNKKHGKKTK